MFSYNKFFVHILIFTIIFNERSSFTLGQQPVRGNVVEDIQLRLYTGTTLSQFVDYKLAQSLNLLTNSQFVKTNPTVFYVHGYAETAENESVKVVVSAYLQAQPDTNVVLVDWSNMAGGNYIFNSAPNTVKVAKAVAVEIKKLIDQGLVLDKIHFVGHSLGGQTVGFMGRELQKIGTLIKRITALDPAFPFFYPGIFAPPINAQDGAFVDLIHTDAGFYGAPVPTGTVDFWPNGGTGKQPGCSPFPSIPMTDESYCSHWRSWRFWAESVLNPSSFPAVSASSYLSFKLENNRPNLGKTLVYMGPNTDTNAKGNYYLRTNGASPYGRGTDGTYVTSWWV